jgi:hypothetical protein
MTDMGFGSLESGGLGWGKDLFLLWVDFFEKLFARLYMVVHISLFTFYNADSSSSRYCACTFAVPFPFVHE